MRFLIDEMFHNAVAERLRDLGHDAVHVREIGLAATEDAVVVATARAEQRAVTTENVADFAGERDVILVFVRKSRLPAGGGAQSAALATALDTWARADPEPYIGQHWPL